MEWDKDEIFIILYLVHLLLFLLELLNLYQLLQELKLLWSGNFKIILLRNTIITIVPVEAVQQLHLSRCYRYQPWRIRPHPALPRCSAREPAGPAAGYTAAEALGAKVEDSLHPQCSEK